LPEQYIKHNYVVTDLAAIDANIQQTDSTTEGATLAWEEVTNEWLANHGFVEGTTVETPWLFQDDVLILWYEAEVEDDVDNIMDGNNNDASKKLMLDGQLFIIHNGKTYNIMGVPM
jgi:hypothetical protein